MKRKFVVTSLLLLVLLCCGTFLHAQAEKRRFEVTFKINGEAVEDFQFVYLLNGEEIVPERDGRTIYVPQKIYDAAYSETGMRLFSGEHQVTFQGGGPKGYLEDDEILIDLEVGLDTKPAVIVRQHLSKLSKQEKRRLGIRRNRDLCQVSWVTASNVRVKPKNLIVDPTISIQYIVCDPKKR